MSWKNDENIFHQKCTKQHCLITESVSIDACDEITLIPVKKNTSFFMFVDYYKVLPRMRADFNESNLIN